MTDAVIVSAARTPIGRARKGSPADAFRLIRVAMCAGGGMGSALVLELR